MKENIKYSPVNELKKWLEEILKMEDPQRIHIVQQMMEEYIRTVIKRQPHEVDALVQYLNSQDQRLNFAKAVNNINLLVTCTFMSLQASDFQKLAIFLLKDSRQDPEVVRKMKKYYLSNVDINSFANRAFNEQEAKTISNRLQWFARQYHNLFV